MELYGYTFEEIWRGLPLPARMLVVAAIAFVMVVCVYFTQLAARPGADSSAGPVKFAGVSVYDGTDPALASDGRRVLLAFSDLAREKAAPRGGAAAGGKTAGISLAASTAPCAAWKILPGAGFAPYDEILTGPDGVTSVAAGGWRYETPAVVFDPGDPGREWKLLAFKYFWPNNGDFAAVAERSLIVMRTAPAPEGPWSEEGPLLAARDGFPAPPYGEGVALHLSAQIPELADIAMFARPSLARAGPALVLSLSGFYAGEKLPRRTALLASEDHGASWQYLGSPLSRADAPKAGAGGFDAFAGATLLKAGERVLLAAVFGGKEGGALGTEIYPFADISTALLARDPETGAPRALLSLPRLSARPTATGGGFATYAEACTATGIVTGEHSGLLGRFQIFMSRRGI